jgi:uncharacterized protein with HEPN domain
MNRADVVRLRHMLDAVMDAISFVEGVQRDALDENRMLSLSLVKCVEILGEAASRVSENVRVRHPKVPWRVIVGMRNHLIHAYYDVNLDILWQTVREDLPPLIPALEEILTTADEHLQ